MAIDVKTTLARVVACLLVLGANVAQAADSGLEIREQPQSVKRPQLVRIAWAGPSAHVVVERRHGLFWVTEGSDASGEVVLETGGGLRSARWQPSYYSPAGTYRIRLEAHDLALTSDDFEVRPCRCVVSEPLRTRWHHRRFHVSVRASYWPGPVDGFLQLPVVVMTGRPLVRVLRDGRRVGSILLRYARGKFRGTWPGPRGPRYSVVFQLIALNDRFANG